MRGMLYTERERSVADRVAWPRPSINGSHVHNAPRVCTLVPFIIAFLIYEIFHLLVALVSHKVQSCSLCFAPHQRYKIILLYLYCMT